MNEVWKDRLAEVVGAFLGLLYFAFVFISFGLPIVLLLLALFGVDIGWGSGSGDGSDYTDIPCECGPKCYC